MLLMRLLSLIVFLVLPLNAHAQLDASRYEETIKITIKALLNEHLCRPTLDHALSKEWLDKYLDMLDPSRIYFFQSDIDEFRTYHDQMTTYAAEGETKLIDEVTERLRDRASAALRQGIELLHRDVDFSIDEEFELSPESWPRTKTDLKERWRVKLKYELLIEKSSGSTLQDARLFLESRYRDLLDQAIKFDEEQAVTAYLRSFCRSVDPHSDYFSEKELTSFMGGMLKEYSIGLMTKETRSGKVICGFASGFRNRSAAKLIVGCQLLAIRDSSGATHHVCEIVPSNGNKNLTGVSTIKEWVTLELYDETRLKRFAVRWPRK